MAENLLKDMDEDNSGTVSFDEFSLWWAQNKNKKSKGRFASLFKRKKGAKRQPVPKQKSDILFGDNLQQLAEDGRIPQFLKIIVERFDQLCADQPSSIRVDKLTSDRQADVDNVRTR